MRRPTAFVFLLALAVVVAACSDPEAEAAGTTTTVPASSTTSPAASTTTEGSLADLPPTTIDIVETTTTTTTIDIVELQYGSPAVTGSALPPTGDDPDPAVGLAAPVVTGTGYDGSEVTIGGGTQQAVLFVAHWCPHCQNELPQVVQWLDDTGGMENVDVVLVTVAVDPNRPNFPPSDWIEREGWTGPLLRDDAANSAFIAYGGSAIPYWVFIDGDGTVIGRISGEVGYELLTPVFDQLFG